LAVVTANLPAKPDTVISNKVTIKGEKQAVQLFGPAQAAVARAVVDSVAEGVIPKDQVDDLCLIVGVFIHWEAADDKKIYDYNYEAVKLALARAIEGYPSVDKVLADTPDARHPFAGGGIGVPFQPNEASITNRRLSLGFGEETLPGNHGPRTSLSGFR